MVSIMAEDILEARECLNWTKSQIPSLQRRLETWCNDNISTFIKETNAEASHDVIVAVEKEPLPLTFGVEVGAYVNVLRTSLDILAITLAKRYGATNLKAIYFPVGPSQKEFESGGHKGLEFLRTLPARERSIIESLKPYKGGNDTLYVLHRLDITRKHHRLLVTNHAPARMRLRGAFRHEDITFPNIADGWVDSGNGEILLALIRKGSVKPKIDYAPEIFITELDLGFRQATVPALDNFASLVNSIIDLFDRP